MSAVDTQNPDQIDRALDDRLSEAERAEFQADVVRDPALRAAYTERVWLHAQLRAERDRLPQILAEKDETVAPVQPATRGWPMWSSVSLAAAACVLFAATWLRTPAPPPAPVPVVTATLVQASNTRWAGSTLPTVENAQLGPGMLALVEGIATLAFASGATVTLEAPTKFEILSAMSGRLLEGSVTAEVPVAARGFSIETADLRVVDLGTRFGLTAGSAGNSHVFVFEGEVSVSETAGGRVRQLRAGERYHIASGPTTAAAEPRRFESDLPIAGWTAITTASGRGRDAYVRRGYATAAGREPFIMVKHTDLAHSERNERRGFLTFDLAGIDARAVKEVHLVLDPEPSGLGFSAMVPDATFAIYGVTDEALDDWGEDALAWDEAMKPLSDNWPPNARVRRLAGFALPRGGSGNPLTIGSATLTEFLREDTNGLATFVVVRETGESNPAGLVHAFASKEHPSARPPTLRVR